MRIKKYTNFINERWAQIEEPEVQSEVNYETNSDKEYQRLYMNQLLMLDVVAESGQIIKENKDEVISRIANNTWEVDTPELAESFLASINTSTRIEFITPYTADELSNFRLFKVDGMNIGFAIKEDGDIILVHNNEGIGGIGNLLIQKAIELGGEKLDYFDGFLTGFYRNLGFKLTSNEHFNDEWAPEGWKFEAIDIDNPQTSIYAEELEVTVDEKIEAVTRYKAGKPDVAYRSLK
jgi:hypothetical protein